MDISFPLRIANTAAGRGMAQTPSASTPPSPANYDFLMRRASAVYEAQFEDAILSIGSAMTAVEFRDTVKSGIHLAFLNVKHSLVMLLDVESSVLAYYETNTSFKTLTKDGVVWECVRRRMPEMAKMSIPEDDPIRTLMPNLQPLEKDQVVVIRPVVEKKEHRVVALLLVVCDEPSAMVMERVRWLERNILVAASRVLKHMMAERERARAESMLEVCGALIDLDTSILSLKIVKHLRRMLCCEVCLLLLFDDSTHELVCQVFDETALDREIRLQISSSSLYGRCYLNGEITNIEDVSKDARFDPTTDIINDYEPSTMLCMPVTVGQGVNIAVAVACNKQGGKKFTVRDQENMSFILRFSSSVLSNTLAFQRELTLKKQNQALLQVAGNLFSKLDDLDHLLAAIMNEARMLTKAEKCSLFLLDPDTKELVATVFDSGPSEILQKPLRIKIGQGIAGYVAKVGRLVNIRDAYKHPMFFKEVDKTTGFVTRNILCFPIKDSSDDVVGVAELVNKVGANFFTKYDEELATTFSVYCGISLHQSKLYNKMIESQGRSNIATELMIYHMNVPEEEVDRVATAVIPACTNYSENFAQFTYYPLISPDTETVLAVVSMMEEMNLIRQWKIPRKTIARFVLMVKKGYRDPPYHNWSHAFSVAHFCYTLYKNCNGLSVLTDLEVLALFISCLCHDIDHRGTNNAFQVSSNSVLASLYSSEGSVMERHHFTQTLSILNTKGCNVFEHFSPANYKAILDLIHHIILATDIANHLRHMKQIKEMSESGYDSSNPTHHKLMTSLLMTSCDLCSVCKTWDMAKMVSDLIYAEFFSQGDLEKALGVTPIEMMDRDRAFIPEQQVSFLDGIAGPVYKVLSKLLPRASATCEAIDRNRMKWIELQKEGRRTPDPEQQLS